MGRGAIFSIVRGAGHLPRESRDIRDGAIMVVGSRDVRNMSFGHLRRVAAGIVGKKRRRLGYTQRRGRLIRR